MPAALREFLREETAGGAALMAATVLALLWANSPWQGAYDALWHTPLDVRLGRFELGGDLRQWVNEGLMALFFLVVGLEIKRELVDGELRSWRRAALPVVAAAGGMLLPAAIYAAFNAGGPGAAGWGVPMATDVAFALGVLALLGPRVPPVLKLFLLTLAIVDDLGSILVVAGFYSGALRLPALAAAAAVVVAVLGLRRARIDWMPPYVACGAGLWLALHAAGVNAALAGAAMGLLAPARPVTPPGALQRSSQALASAPGPWPLQDALRQARGTVSTVERLEHGLHPLSAFLVVPLFALANAGVTLHGGALAERGAPLVLAGVVAGRVLGKPAGILLAVWLALRLRLGAWPAGTGWRQLAGVATVAGIGFTVPLFVADLAFPGGRFGAAVKLGLLLASLASGTAGVVILRASLPPRAAG
ncbi:MAG TPA: Na+/H+ antiporter NhaA [Actinomycetota bacterium]|jgi:NhaA family Na+:H+ antiporter